MDQDKASGEADLFTRDQLQELGDGMVMGDVWRAVQASPDNKGEAGFRAFHNAAMRLGLMPRDSLLEDFLDRVRQQDFVAVRSQRDALEGKDGLP